MRRTHSIENVGDLLRRVGQAHAQAAHQFLEPLDVVVQPEEAAFPDMGDIIGRIRPDETAIGHRDAGFSQWNVVAVGKCDAVRWIVLAFHDELSRIRFFSPQKPAASVVQSFG